MPMPAALRLLARSCCITPGSLASVEEEEEEEAAQDTSSMSSRADIMMTFPDMAECKRRRIRERGGKQIITVVATFKDIMDRMRGIT